MPRVGTNSQRFSNPGTPGSERSVGDVDEELLVLLESLEKQLDDANAENEQLLTDLENERQRSNSAEMSLKESKKAVQEAKLKQAEAENEASYLLFMQIFLQERACVSAAERGKKDKEGLQRVGPLC